MEKWFLLSVWGQDNDAFIASDVCCEGKAAGVPLTVLHRGMFDAVTSHVSRSVAVLVRRRRPVRLDRLREVRVLFN